MIRFLFLVVFSFVSTQAVLHDFGNKKLFDYDFFYEQQKNQWLEFSFDQQLSSFDSFLKKELAVYDASVLGLDLLPSVYSLIEERKEQLAVNHYYERFVALPLVEPSYLQTTKENLGRELFVYHILFGYEGCALEGVFPDKDSVLGVAADFSNQIKKELKESSLISGHAALFKEFALSLSDDPSVSQNGGLLGWVSWGRSIDDFQVPLFLLEGGGVSSPILTPYGYHIVFVEKERPSSFSFYSPELFKDFSNKACMQSLEFDLLRSASASHDSLLLAGGAFSINSLFVDDLLFDLNLYLNEEGLRGGKKNFLAFLEKNRNAGVLFVFKGRGFGVGWLIEKISKTPSTRIPLLQNKEDFVSTLSSFVLQEEIVGLALEKGIFDFPLVSAEVDKHTKNIVYNEYVKALISDLEPLDSLYVKSKYKEGLLDSLYFSPERAVVYDLNFTSFDLADSVHKKLLEGVVFDSFLSSPTKKIISRGSSGLLGDAAFSLAPGGVSGIIKNADTSFSILRVLEFLPPEPIELFGVYSQIEKQILKKQKKEIKSLLLPKLKEKYSFSFNIKDLY